MNANIPLFAADAVCVVTIVCMLLWHYRKI
jgi:hypothetical protein